MNNGAVGDDVLCMQIWITFIWIVPQEGEALQHTREDFNEEPGKSKVQLCV